MRNSFRKAIYSVAVVLLILLWGNPSVYAQSLAPSTDNFPAQSVAVEPAPSSDLYENVGLNTQESGAKTGTFVTPKLSKSSKVAMLVYDGLSHAALNDVPTVPFGTAVVVRIIRVNTFKYSYTISGQTIDYHTAQMPSQLSGLVTSATISTTNIAQASLPLALNEVPADLQQPLKNFDAALHSFASSVNSIATLDSETNDYDQLQMIVDNGLTNVLIRREVYAVLTGESPSVSYMYPENEAEIPVLNIVSDPSQIVEQDLTFDERSKLATAERNMTAKVDSVSAAVEEAYSSLVLANQSWTAASAEYVAVNGASDPVSKINLYISSEFSAAGDMHIQAQSALSDIKTRLQFAQQLVGDVLSAPAFIQKAFYQPSGDALAITVDVKPNQQSATTASQQTPNASQQSNNPSPGTATTSNPNQPSTNANTATSTGNNAGNDPPAPFTANSNPPGNTTANGSSGSLGGTPAPAQKPSNSTGNTPPPSITPPAKLGNDSQQLSESTFVYTTQIYNRPVLDFSTGVAVFPGNKNPLVSRNYYLRSVTSGASTSNIVEEGAQNEFGVDTAVFAHYYRTPRSSSGVSFGPTLGITTGSPSRYLFGLSLEAGREARVFLTTGYGIGNVTVLDGDAVGQATRSTSGSPATTSVERGGFFVSASFVFGFKPVGDQSNSSKTQLTQPSSKNSKSNSTTSPPTGNQPAPGKESQ